MHSEGEYHQKTVVVVRTLEIHLDLNQAPESDQRLGTGRQDEFHPGLVYSSVLVSTVSTRAKPVAAPRQRNNAGAIVVIAEFNRVDRHRVD